nr:MAG TPA_asm: hypothetical protein [Caudoviricetes sp.]
MINITIRDIIILVAPGGCSRECFSVAIYWDRD